MALLDSSKGFEFHEVFVDFRALCTYHNQHYCSLNKAPSLLHLVLIY